MRPGKASEWQGDKSYHSRHTRRSLARANTIAGHLPQAGSFLDVGCNWGLTSSFLLAGDKISTATGIELASNAVNPELLGNPRFSLLNGDVCNIKLHEQYQSIFYGAVHHHIVRERGLGEAIRVLQMLARHCSGSLFFESGHLAEGGRWQWQRVLRSYFRTDEEHIHYLLRSLEPQLKAVSVIGQFRMHGARRWLLKIDLHGAGARLASQTAMPDSPAGKRGASLGRSFGSRQQELLESPQLIKDSGLEFFHLQTDQEHLFIKKRAGLPLADLREFSIGSQIPHRWAVRAKGLYRDGMAFPWIDGRPLLACTENERHSRRKIVAGLREIWRDAAACRITLEPSLLSPLCRTESARLLDIVDFNPNNFLLTGQPGAAQIRVVDFEFHAEQYLWKNRLSFARLFCSFGAYGTAFVFYLHGAALLLRSALRAQLQTAEWRIQHRQPALFSSLYTELRSLSGRLLVRILPFLDEK